MAAWRSLAALVLLAASAAVVLGCANPKGGCKLDLCHGYDAAGLNSWSQASPGARGDWSSKSYWAAGGFPLIGFALGVYNKNFNSGVYPKLPDGSAPAGTPALNWERFDYPTSQYATPYATSNIGECCAKCAATDGCVAYQFFPAGDKKKLRTSFNVADPSTDPVVGPTQYQCFLLSGGSDTTDFPVIGLPYSGSHTVQTSAPRSNLVLSFVGGRCNPKLSDDPHFEGARGTKFEFNGELEKSFCLTTDVDVQLNVLLRGYESGNTFGATTTAAGKGLRSWVKEVGLLWKDAAGARHSLHLAARQGSKATERGAGFVAKAAVDGVEFAMPAVEGQALALPGGLKLTFHGTGKHGSFDMDRFNVLVPGKVDMDLSLRAAHRLLQTAQDSFIHFNVLINDLKTTEKVHGVLGQTYRNTPAQAARAVKYSELAHLLGKPVQADGETGRGFLDGQVVDYETSAVTSSDCKYSSF